jgi:hypothetical protein
MRKITEQELKEILEKHLKWFKGEEGGERADLSNADLSYTNLENANLYKADLSNADLSNAVLSNANLRYANLSNASLYKVDLSNADLSNANLFNVDLYKANLENANLFNVDLSNANLSNAVLSNADLRYANLSDASLYNANLYNVNLENVNLFNANLENANLNSARLSESEKCRLGIIIQEPRMAYKKCGNYIVQLSIPKGAIVFSINNNQCRANKATPIAILNLDGTISKRISISSDYDNNFRYKLMEEIEIQDFDLMYNTEHTSGIHFFWDFDSARDYN